MLRLLGRLAFFCTILAVVVELFFRFVVPGGHWASRIQDHQYGVMYFDTSDVRDGLYTSGRLAQQRSRWHVNNAGWNSPIEYSAPGPGRKPVIAIIGSSYVEGYHVEGEHRVASVLQRDLKDRYEVYAFGQAGAALGQFMNVARYAAAKYDPDIFIFVLEDGDLRGCLRHYDVRPRDLQVDFVNGQAREVPPAVERPSRIKKYFRYSAFAWYLRANARVTFFGGDAAVNTGAGRSTFDDAQDSLMVQAARYIAHRLVEDHPGKKIVFVADGPRHDIYAGNPVVSTPVISILNSVCTDSNEYVLDLTPVLQQRYARERKLFNFKHDYHWNAYGHQVAADAIADFLLRRRIVE
jgi:hypothetical protein